MKERIERVASELDDIILNEDGDFVYWPAESRGFQTATELRILADILDEYQQGLTAVVASVSEDSPQVGEGHGESSPQSSENRLDSGD